MSASVSSGSSELPSVHIGLPPASLLKFPPAPYPETIPAPPVDKSWAQPFTIPPALYNKLLAVQVPITVALVYATSVILINRINKKRGYKPWPISQTRVFHLFVIFHNVFLAIYSAWTFVGMMQAFRDSWPQKADKYNLVNVVDALCKINGPRGLGNAAIYDSHSNTWSMTNPEYKLGVNNAPDPTDVGRLWNKGLAFYGWIFYLSKFYEVLDTAIILAKGKKSSTLQTYHHAGAMMCMWAGIRYMAAPIWIFALVNSGIHALMYTYYTLTAMSVPIPVRIKRSLTTMQITQFIIGTIMAASHLFISYTLPVAVPRQIALSPMASVMSSISDASNDSSVDSGMGPWLKKLALRAAGAEGVAENVVNSQGHLFGADGTEAAQAALGKQETRFAIEPRTFTCMDTSGQAFAVWLNVLYLLPLTYLFARFFVRSYLHRAERRARNIDTSKKHPVEKAGMDALKGVTREIRSAVMEMHGEESSEGGMHTDTNTSTPHPEAYEANVEDIMTKQQMRVERRLSETTDHPEPPHFLHNSGPGTGTSTPLDPKGYEANVEGIMNRKQRSANRRASQTLTHPIGTKEFTGSKGGHDTPRDVAAYEVDIEQIMDPHQRHIDADPEDSTAPTQHEERPEGTFTPERGYEANWEDMLNKREMAVEEQMAPHPHPM